MRATFGTFGFFPSFISNNIRMWGFHLIPDIAYLPWLMGLLFNGKPPTSVLYFGQQDMSKVCILISSHSCMLFNSHSCSSPVSAILFWFMLTHSLLWHQQAWRYSTGTYSWWAWLFQFFLLQISMKLFISSMRCEWCESQELFNASSLQAISGNKDFTSKFIYLFFPSCQAAGTSKQLLSACAFMQFDSCACGVYTLMLVSGSLR